MYWTLYLLIGIIPMFSVGLKKTLLVRCQKNTISYKISTVSVDKGTTLPGSIVELDNESIQNEIVQDSQKL